MGTLIGTYGSIVSWNRSGLIRNAPSGNKFAAVAVNEEHSLALIDDGSIVSWGDDSFGQVSNTPSGNDFTAIAAGVGHSLALRSDGSIVSWGSDEYGQVSGTPSGNDFTVITADRYNSMALRNNGVIVTWGRDEQGQVSNTPNGSGFVAIAAGIATCHAISSDGSIVSWGYDEWGQVSDTPSDSDFVAVSAGDMHSVALRSDGSIVSWGSDEYGGPVSNTPLGNDFMAISAGGSRSLAIRNDGSIISWGDSDFAPSGDGFVAIAANAWFRVSLALRAEYEKRTNDCNGNGIPDDCDIAAGTSLDCNGNGIPDECDIADGNSLDCNGNGIPDECDMADGNSLDCNANGIQDECDIAVQEMAFESPSIYSIYGGYRLGVAAGDIGGDNDLDLIVASNAGISILFNNGDGTFRDAVQLIPTSAGSSAEAVVTGDLDNDGDVDIVVSERYSEVGDDPWNLGEYYEEVRLNVFRNMRDATFELADELHIGAVHDVGGHLEVGSPCIGDLDGDDDIDLVVLHSGYEGNEICLFLNYGDGTFEEKGRISIGDEQTEVLNMAVNDFDDDDDLDLAAVAGSDSPDEVARLAVFSNTGAADFEAPEYYDLGKPDPTSLTSADFDQDGYIDLAVLRPYAVVSLLLNNQDGTFSEGVHYVFGGGPRVGIIAGDVDRDGDFDLIASSADTDSVLMMRNNGRGEFTDPVSLPGGGNCPVCVLAADLDRDRLLDLAVVNRDSQDVTVLLNRSTSTSLDCNGNGVPDECDMADGNSLDCNANGIPDECDIASGRSTDENEDGVPDECQIDIRVVPVAVLTDPGATTEVRTALPDSVEAVVRGSTYYLEVWSSDIGLDRPGLTGIYVDISFCGQTSALTLDHGTIFPDFTAGAIQPGGVDEFGGLTFSSGVGIEPNWVRVGWIKMIADVNTTSCSISLLPSTGGVAQYGLGLVPWTFVGLGSLDLEIQPPARSYNLDGDAIIGLGDFSLFVPSWQQAVPPAANAHDFDCDCFVGVGDLSWFATGWMKSPDDPTILYPPCPGGGSCGESAPMHGLAARGLGLAPLGTAATMTSGPIDADVAFESVVLNAPSESDTTTDLPASIGSISEGQTYYVEVWVSDVGDISTGITSAYVDLTFPADAAGVTSISYGSLFTLFPDGSAASGLIDELGGSTLSEAIGIAPQWARVAVIQMHADTAPPSVAFSLLPSTMGVAAWGRGPIDWDDIYLGRASVPPMIAGFVRTPHGRGVGGVVVSADNGGGLGVTDPSGYYEFVVPSAWSGMVAPGSADFSLSFDPDGLSYSNVTNIYDNQDYTAWNICDLDDNDQVNTADFAYFADYWLKAGYLPGNFDLQDTVSYPDLDIFIKNWLWRP